MQRRRRKLWKKMSGQTDVNDEIRVKIVYNGEVQITYITAGMTVDTLREEMRTICGFSSSGNGADQFTMKWVDDEGDPCRIASQQELDEALRLYELEKDTEITIHGQSCLFLFLFLSKLRLALFKNIPRKTNTETGGAQLLPKFKPMNPPENPLNHVLLHKQYNKISRHDQGLDCFQNCNS
ncbi:hypothetical protein KQX54_014113 [Cotesia glomerata]|uniref:PB1 domain-containing protein n=1 Tax=Cotesia glomerata TaxID=32391 RepID=A0AAV7IL12_COTGL|nr:hypothetical protein KQX54_014113 [Cotesia glomerata]